MSVHGPYAGREKPWKVAWRLQGKQKGEWFASEAEAIAFDELPRDEKATALSATPVAPVAEVGELPEGVFAYATSEGPRYRFNAVGTGRRGFATPAAALKAKGAFEELYGRGEVAVGNERFEPVWLRFLAAKRPFISDGAYENLERDGRLHLLPFFREDRLKAIDVERVLAFVSECSLLVADEEVAPKTVNNWLTHLSMFFNWCLPQKSIPIVVNPCQWVGHLPVEQEEIRFFELAAIPRYYEGCSRTYRPLAEFLIGTGTRVSEAVAVKVSDLDLDDGLVRIYRQRGRRGAMSTRQTKGKKFRTVELGDGLVGTLRTMLAIRAEHEVADGGWLFLCPQPKRGRYAKRTEPVPPHRKTVNEWHEAALETMNKGAKQPWDVTLHGLRHTAAASWLASGFGLYFVQRQLGHRDVTTTERHYAHLERSYTRTAVAETERRIEAARRQGLLLP